MANVFGNFVDNVGAGPERGRYMVVGVMRFEWVEAAHPDVDIIDGKL